ncbi:MAG: efflux RND transporter periplasmic adaptor subunit [Syntrophomonadaceae bacterium]|nr:efflux RND transporter periplasmic adaptor subunit [Syntrophomonadaceae bacterium]MDD4549383.1 efflux RND transporter periplasmic adaptor subunit [Syntrophomonadaceae bacterium]
MEQDTKRRLGKHLSLKSWLKKIPRWLKITMALVLIMIVGIGGIAQAAKNKPVPVQIHSVSKQDIEKIVVTNGRLKAVNEQVFFTPVDSTLMELNVKVGDRVKEGDILGRLDTLELGRRYQNALAIQAGKEAELAQALAASDELALKAAEAEYTKAKNHMERINKLHNAGATALEELEISQTEVARAESSYHEARIKVEQGASAKLKSSLQAQVDLGRQETAQAKERLDLATFVASHDGVVTYAGAKQGNQVMEGTELLVLSDDSELQVNANINEIDAGYLKTGQKVDIRCIALLGQKYAGEITRIGNAAIIEKGGTGETVNIPITIKLKGNTTGLKVGYTTDMSIKMLLKKDVTVVPVESIFERNGKRMVYIVKGDRLQERKITTKIGNELYDVVSSGLKEGEKIVKNPDQGMRSGLKVVEAPEGVNND